MEIYEMCRDYWFPKPPTANQLMRENRRVINRTVRDLDRDKMKLDQQEKHLVQNLKTIVKEGTDSRDVLKGMAKDLVRVRNSAKKLVQLKSQMQAIDMRLTTLNCTNTMCASLQSVTKMMNKMNAQMSVQKIGKIMMEFEKQNARANEAAEMMDDVIGDAFAGDEEGEESDVLINQILDEIGCNVAADMANLPAVNAGAGAPKPTGAEKENDDDVALNKELESRLQSLRKQ